MNIYPAIDLLSGCCVRLYQGRYEQVTLYGDDPVAIAQSFVQQGADFLHIIDLAGAKQGKSVHLDLILNIRRQTGLAVQMGGGIRSYQQVKSILKGGIERVILGSIAVTQPQEVKSWMAEFGSERFVLALDVRLDENNIPQLTTQGWRINSNKNLWELLADYQHASLRYVLCTDVHRDGTLRGPNFDLYEKCVKHYPQVGFQASGGVSCLNDLTRLLRLNVEGVIIGKALYENKFSLRAACQEIAVC